MSVEPTKPASFNAELTRVPRARTGFLTLALQATGFFGFWGAIYQCTRTAPYSRDYGSVAFTAGAFAIVALVGMVLRERRARFVRRKRTEFASNVVAAIRLMRDTARSDSTVRSATSAPSFALYLRPAALDTHMSINNPHASGLARHSVPDAFDLEEIFANAFADTSPMVTVECDTRGVRQTGDFAGGGGVTLGQEWMSIVADLMAHARLVCVLPGTSEGIGWEIEQVVHSDSIRKKTIWIMPPQVTKLIDVKEHWAAARTTCSRIHIALPAYDPKGALLLLTRSGSFLSCCDLSAPDGWARKFGVTLLGLVFVGLIAFVPTHPALERKILAAVKKLPSLND